VTVDGSPAVEGREAPARDERWFLADEREFLRRSLQDAEREHDAGDLSDDDHALLVARDTTRLAEVEADLAALVRERETERVEAEPPVGPERPPLPLWRKVGVVAACLLIVTGGVILVTHYVQARQPGQASSGSVTLSQAQLIEQQLQEALAQNNAGQTRAALVLYDKVLSEDPSDPAALAYAGYLQWDVGSAASVPSLVKIGRAEIAKSIAVSPSYYEGHLFYGLVLENQDHNAAAAVVQFDDFLADDPPTAELPQVAADVAPAYQEVGQPLPAKFGTTSTSTSAP
jgi:hypothetical protein